MITVFDETAAYLDRAGNSIQAAKKLAAEDVLAAVKQLLR